MEDCLDIAIKDGRKSDQEGDADAAGTRWMTINVLAPTSPLWVSLPSTPPNNTRQGLSSFTTVMAPKGVGEHRDETDPRIDAVQRRIGQIHIPQVVQRPRTPSWNPESNHSE